MRPFSCRAWLVSLCLLLAGCAETTPETPAQGPPPAVTVARLVAQPVTLQRELPGRVQPSLLAEVRPQVGGLVRQRLFEEGSDVLAGQALYELEPAVYRANRANALAELRRAEAALETARSRARRADALIAGRSISAQEHDLLRAAEHEAVAEVAASRALLDSAEIVLSQARIVAPISGRIGRSAVTVGALVTAMQQEPLVLIQQLDPVYIDLSQSSSELLALRQALGEGHLQATDDLPVQILLEDGSAYTQPGHLAFSDVSVDPATSSYLLRVVVPNPEGVLLPGMFVRARLASGSRDNAVLVPQRAIVRDAKGGTQALVVAADGTVEQRAVSLGQAIGDHWLVEAGLAAGEQVIIEGLQKARHGARVEAHEAATPAAG